LEASALIKELLGAVLMTTPTVSGEMAQIEVDTVTGQYRGVIRPATELTIDRTLLEDANGLAPGIAAIFVQDEDGNPITCPGDGKGYRSSTMSSSFSMSPSRPLVIAQGTEFQTKWYRITALFHSFYLCASEPDKAKWSSFRIRIDLPTKSGTTVVMESPWMAIPDSIKA
jgi:hypothetical protein